MSKHRHLLGGLLLKLAGVLAAAVFFVAMRPAHAADMCAALKINARASQPLAKVVLSPAVRCGVRASRGSLLPDPACTPGAVNPTVTAAVLRDPRFLTGCVRDGASSKAAKAKTYAWYGIAPPARNVGADQTCELDHLISLELGGADTLDNLWPQCGPGGAPLAQRRFKQKDAVENYLAREVRAGRLNLQEAQRGIAADWTQYLIAAQAAHEEK